jgi:hypothetical protein
MGSDRHENENGNWVLAFDGSVEATVYATADGQWGAIWNGASDGKARRLKGKYDQANHACDAVDLAIEEGEKSLRWWPTDDQWQMAKKGGFYRKINGLTVSVKQAKSGSWFAVNAAGGFLGKNGRPTWFSTEKEALAAVDTLAVSGGGWRWVASRAA